MVSNVNFAERKTSRLPARRFLLRNLFERKHLVRSARRDRPHPTTAVIDPVSARYLVKRRRLWRTGWVQRVISGIEETRDHYPPSISPLPAWCDSKIPFPITSTMPSQELSGS